MEKFYKPKKSKKIKAKPGDLKVNSPQKPIHSTFPLSKQQKFS